MPTKTELQAALRTQEQALNEARSREASLRYQLHCARIAIKMIIDDLKRKLELPTQYDETGQELAERYEAGIQLAATRAETIWEALIHQSPVDLTETIWRPIPNEDEAYIESQRMLQEVQNDTNTTINENN